MLSIDQIISDGAQEPCIYVSCVFNKAGRDGLLGVVTFWEVKWRRKDVPDK